MEGEKLSRSMNMKTPESLTIQERKTNGRTGSPSLTIPVKCLFSSSCLLGKRCLYHGWRATFALPVLGDLERRGIQIVYACAEMLGGLPWPRRPARVFQGIVWMSRGQKGRRDVTAEFTLGAQKALEILTGARAEAALLLKDSPSCDPSFGIFGCQVRRLVPGGACKRGPQWAGACYQ